MWAGPGKRGQTPAMRRASSQSHRPREGVRPLFRYGVQRTGFTLPEMLVTIVIVTIVAAIAIPTLYSIREGFTSSGADTLISAALASAKAIAAKEQKYAGIHFQCVPDPEDPTKPGDQYMIFIIQDPSLQNIGVNGFRAAKGIEPVKLPINQAVTDLIVKDDYTDDPTIDKNVTDNASINDAAELWDATTFSIVFSPSGRLVTHTVKVWNKDGAPYNDNTSTDIIFNTKTNVEGAIAGTVPGPGDPETYEGMFYEDVDTPAATRPVPGIGQESSRKSFVIFDRRAFEKVPASNRWSDFFKEIKKHEELYINPYTGTIIENENRRNAMK